MSDEFTEQFIEIRCCGQGAGFVNARPFTAEASARFAAIQERLGNDWIYDPEANALTKDRASYATPADGTPISFGCLACGTRFVWAGGVPSPVSSA